MAALLLGGCGFSIHEFYADADVVDFPELEGRWEYNDEGKTAFVEYKQVGRGAFQYADCKDSGPEAVAPLQIFRVNGDLYADYQDELEARYGPAILPHGLMRLRAKDGGWEWRMLDAEKVGKQVKRLKLAHTYRRKSLLVVAERPALRQFVASHGNDLSLFGDPVVMKKSGPLSADRPCGKWVMPAPVPAPPPPPKR
jgi:hypothetical protein